MRVALAQITSIPGDIEVNLTRHDAAVREAVELGPDLIVFPELSVTGYEPAVAAQLPMTAEDARLVPIDRLSREYGVAIAVGVPLWVAGGTAIAMVIFGVAESPQVYAKRHLHPDEEDYFVPGPNLAPIRWKQDVIALSICYELSVPEHARGSFGAGATAYVASVAKKHSNVQAARRRLRDISREYAAPVCMVNTVGPCEGAESPGLSAVWNHNGRLAAELPPDRQGILFVDVFSGELGSSTARELG